MEAWSWVSMNGKRTFLVRQDIRFLFGSPIFPRFLDPSGLCNLCLLSNVIVSERSTRPCASMASETTPTRFGQ